MSEEIERQFLASCYTDPEQVDKAIQRGVSDAYFRHSYHREQWRIIVYLRLQGRPVDAAGVYSEASKQGRIEEVGGLDRILRCSDTSGLGCAYEAVLGAFIDSYAKSQALMVAIDLHQNLERNTISLDETRELGERIVELASPRNASATRFSDVVDSALKAATDAIEGKAPEGRQILTGLGHIDRLATPVESHEYVILGARTSHGKSTLMVQMADYNLRKGARVAFFTLETSAQAVVNQIASQRSGANVRAIKARTELREREQAFMKELNGLRGCKNMLIFDQDISLGAIESRSRLIAASFKPDVVFLDYIGLVGVDGTSAYERMSRVSKAMIPLRKSLGCALIVGAQLNRSSEQDKRQPSRSDFRDSGNLEEDAHRIWALYRKPDQPPDGSFYDYEFLQLKLRDGPITGAPLKFHAPTTRFYEETRA